MMSPGSTRSATTLSPGTRQLQDWRNRALRSSRSRHRRKPAADSMKEAPGTGVAPAPGPLDEAGELKAAASGEPCCCSSDIKVPPMLLQRKATPAEGLVS